MVVSDSNIFVDDTKMETVLSAPFIYTECDLSFGSVCIYQIVIGCSMR